jgi:exosome complex component RRP4
MSDMENYQVEKKSPKIVLPGEFVDYLRGKKAGVGVYIVGEKAFSNVVGVPRIGMYEVSVVPLSGKYIPQFGDKVIGIVDSVEISGWMIDINAPYIGFMPVSEGVEEYVDARVDISKFYAKGDIIACRISRVTSTKAVQCSMRDMMARKLNGGTVIKVTPSKIPRIIGKNGSMINLIRDSTRTEILTGQNGYIWIKGDNKELAIKAILTIDRESHLPGLTERIEEMVGGKVQQVGGVLNGA